MKKLYYLIILTVILGLVLTGCLLSNVGQVPTTERKPNVIGDSFIPGELVAGKNTGVGTVIVWNDAENLYVKYVVNDPWRLTETHLHIFLDNEYFTDVPLKKGNPPPGQFDNKEKHECETNYTYEISLDWDLGTQLFIAAHAKVQNNNEKISDEPQIYLTETAWAAGEDFEGANWATYFEYCYGPGVIDPVSSGATFLDNGDCTGTMYLTVLDKCGNGIEGLELADITVYLGSAVLGSPDLFTLGAGGYWDIDLIDNDNGKYEITFHRTGSVPYTRLWDVIVMDEIIEDDLLVLITSPSDVYTLDITRVNGNPANLHLFTITYFPCPGTATGTGSYSGGTETVSDIVFDFVTDPNKLSFKSVYPNNYTWYPSFFLGEDGTLSFVDGFGGDNVSSAKGTWSVD